VAFVFACIAPHGGIAIAEACAPEQRDQAAVTRRGMEELGRRFDRAKPEVAIVLTPHNIHVEGAMAVVTSGTVSGSLEGHPQVALRLPTDRALALAIRDAIGAEGIPVAGVSYGANDSAAATFPMDWAILVPLWFMGGRSDPPVQTVVIAPARDLPYERHVAAGRAIGKVAAASGKRVALIASCDHGHGHDPNGPYGFTPKSAEFDEQVVALVKNDDLAGLLRMDPTLPAEGKADSYWQMLMLHGALDGNWKGEFLSYEAPTYFGMLCAAYEPG
jgi:aromatic ring-opening dioxygenase LigB subunit